MSKKLQFILSNEANQILENLLAEATEGFVNGTITYSDLLNEIVLNAKIDIRALQAKHVNIRKSLRLMANQKDLDLESAIKTLMELKTRGGKKTGKNVTHQEEEQA